VQVRCLLGVVVVVAEVRCPLGEAEVRHRSVRVEQQDQLH
jgi:hypothetical protein